MVREIRIARALVASSRVARTLYHGTVVDNEDSIKQHGLIGQTGSFVEESYGEYVEEGVDLPDLVFAADKEGLGHAVSAMVHHIGGKLGKSFHDVTDNDILNYGLLVVMKEMAVGHYGLEHRPEGDENYSGKHPYHVEPGDYYAEELQADKFVKGRQLLRLLKRYNQWPRPWGPEDPVRLKQMRGWLVNLALRSDPERDKQEAIDWVQGLTVDQVKQNFLRYRSWG